MYLIIHLTILTALCLISGIVVCIVSTNLGYCPSGVDPEPDQDCQMQCELLCYQNESITAPLVYPSLRWSCIALLLGTVFFPLLIVAWMIWKGCTGGKDKTESESQDSEEQLDETELKDLP